MVSAIYVNLDQSKILLSGNGLNISGWVRLVILQEWLRKILRTEMLVFSISFIEPHLRSGSKPHTHFQ